jgi:hypothetical protein
MRDPGEPAIPRKLTLSVAGRRIVFVKRAGESERHVLLKALVFARYVPDYPDIAVEVGFGHRYKPDLVSLDADGRPAFWAECGETARAKIGSLVSGFRDTHLVFAKQTTYLAPYAAMVEEAWPRNGRSAPVELLNFPPGAAELIGQDGAISGTCDDCEVVRFPGTQRK